MNRLAVTVFALVVVYGATCIDTRAQAIGIDCSFVEYQEDAQWGLENFHATIGTEYVSKLDEDGDGIACNHLPPRPAVLANAERMRADFEPVMTAPTLSGAGDIHHFTVELAMLTYQSPAAMQSACPQLATGETLANMFHIDKSSHTFYVELTDGTVIPPESGERVTFSGLVWTVFEDPANPILLNEWLLRHGLAYFAPPNIPKTETIERLAAAQELAQGEGAGVWGGCTLPTVDDQPQEGSADQERPVDSILFETASGDQVIPFTIETAGTYQVTLEASGNAPILVFLDVYEVSGNWIPGFNISASESGSFSSGGYLEPGNYYVRIKALSAWRITLIPM